LEVKVTDRTYRALVGLALLIGLFLDSEPLVYSLMVIMFIEGITNFRVPMAVCKFRNCVATRINEAAVVYTPEMSNPNFRFNVDAERVWRLVVGSMLFITFHFYDQLWFFPWFMGFAIFGAGLSGVCPVLLAIRWAGFK